MTAEQITATAQSLSHIANAMNCPETAPAAKTLLGYLERNLTAEAKRAEMAARATEGRMKIDGPKLWAEWHTRALLGDPIDEEAERKWLVGFVGKIPCGECRGHFLTLIRTFFAQGFSSYFAKTVAVHNLVNERIGKQTFTTDEAHRLWEAASAPQAA